MEYNGFDALTARQRGEVCEGWERAGWKLVDVALDDPASFARTQVVMRLWSVLPEEADKVEMVPSLMVGYCENLHSVLPNPWLPYPLTASEVAEIDRALNEVNASLFKSSIQPLNKAGFIAICRDYEDAAWREYRIPGFGELSGDIYTLEYHNSLKFHIQAATPPHISIVSLMSGYCAHKLDDGG